MEMSWRKSIFYPRIIRRFKKSDTGATAVEFAFVGGPFFLLIFAIIESSLFFFAGQYLESTVDDVTRLFRTGQFDSSTTEQEFRDEFCARLVVMFDCTQVRTEVQTALNFDELENPDPPDDDDGDPVPNEYSAPAAVQIMQVSAQYRWPVYTNFSAPLKEGSSGDYALIQVVAVTRTEPYE